MNTEAPDLPSQVVADRCHLALPSLPNWIGPAVEYLTRRAVLAGACQETRSAKLTVALHEALTNAVIHGNLNISSALKELGDDAFAEALAQRSSDARFSQRLVDVLMDYNGERCRWIITDEGEGFAVDRVLERVLSDDPEITLASGRGILLMRSFLDGVQFELGGRRLVLTLRHPSGEENRRHERVGLHQTLHIAPVLPNGAVDWNSAYEAVSRNLSEGGVAVLQEQLAQTDRVLIGIVKENQIVYLPAEIRHCRAMSADLVELGCSFTLPQDKAKDRGESAAEAQPVQDAIGELLRERTEGRLGADERRTHQRISYNERIEATTATGERISGFARDLSKGGMAFITTRPLPLDDAFVTLPQTGRQSLTVKCQVARCLKIRDDLYDVGVRFVQLEADSQAPE